MEEKRKVKVRSLLDGKVYDAYWTREHPASSYGQKVLVLAKTKEAVDSWAFQEVKP